MSLRTPGDPNSGRAHDGKPKRQVTGSIHYPFRREYWACECGREVCHCGCGREVTYR